MSRYLLRNNVTVLHYGESPYVGAADVQDHQAKLPVLILVLLVHQLPVVPLQECPQSESHHITHTQPDTNITFFIL